MSLYEKCMNDLSKNDLWANAIYLLWQGDSCHEKNLPYGHWHGSDAKCHVLSRSEIDGDKSQPYNTGCVHTKAYKFRLVEGFGDLSSQHRVHRTNYDQ